MIDEARNATSQLADSAAGSISDPTWSPDGARLAFRRGNRVLEPSSAIDQFEVAGDGQRFLLRRPVGELGTDQAPPTVIVNWRGLARQVPQGPSF